MLIVFTILTENKGILKKEDNSFNSFTWILHPSAVQGTTLCYKQLKKTCGYAKGRKNANMLLIMHQNYCKLIDQQYFFSTNCK